MYVNSVVTGTTKVIHGMQYAGSIWQYAGPIGNHIITDVLLLIVLVLNESLINPFLTRFFAITSPIKTVFFDNSVTLKTALICVYRTNWMCLTKTSVVQ